MAKEFHELRDPIHVFIRMDSDERNVLNSRPFQRLRHVHQLALTSLVYPGATHKRFEHCLGVMELAGRVYDVITSAGNLHKDVREIIPENDDKKRYWRKALRMAALCHDLGHLPFSHAAEKELLPPDWNHERLTVEIIRSAEMRKIWDAMTPPLKAEDIVKLAVGEKELSKFEQISYTPWESILAEIITGDSFGVDRIDYLLRDSYHAGVAYGKFDHYRLIDTLRILPKKSESAQLLDVEQRSDFTDCETVTLLGIDEGGIHSAEALLLARYFMYTQLYFHHVRRIYDIHLKEFLKAWLPEGGFPVTVENHLEITDNEVTSAFLAASRNISAAGHIPAKRLVQRDHLRLLYQRNPDDIRRNPDAARVIYEAACKEFGPDSVQIDVYRQKSSESPHFPVLKGDGRIVWSDEESEILSSKLPILVIESVYVAQEKLANAQKWLAKKRESLLEVSLEEEI
ncbi:HD domain-containing protein [Trichlorobacter sp.]|uniref:HD domain-containing protein n=1 Tax=Trichlorobacter sp. TaxID=2911007 RepID=UPI002A36B4F4|nr:HD domain-containing protein [Trichlorobacter sp.]MDY0383190.1 HD domain-containing protein [Trichlorobacter sp.]